MSIELEGLLLLCIGSVTLSPMMIATVCRVGDPLQLTCTASVEFIRWSIFQANEQGTLVSVINSVQINSRDPYQMSERVVNSATFSFMRSSSEDSLPLVSTLSIDSVSIGLNGTVVRCSNIADPSILSSTTIQIIDINQSKQVIILYNEIYIYVYYHICIHDYNIIILLLS